MLTSSMEGQLHILVVTKLMELVIHRKSVYNRDVTAINVRRGGRYLGRDATSVEASS